MLLELQLDTRNWLYLLPIIQGNLNHAAVESLGGHAPIELFAGPLSASSLDCVVVPDERTPRVLSLDLERLSEQLDNLRAHFREMHGEVVERKERNRLANMARSKGSTCNFEPGDYVLWSRVDKRLQSSKLLVRWVWPLRVTEALAHSFMVEHLLTKDVYEVHGSRLNHYCDADVDVTEELREHIANQGIVLGVRAITEHRYNDEAKGWQLFVAWRGLEDNENSWEPFGSIYSDVPTIVRRYIADGGHTELEPMLH